MYNAFVGKCVNTCDCVRMIKAPEGVVCVCVSVCVSVCICVYLF